MLELFNNHSHKVYIKHFKSNEETQVIESSLDTPISYYITVRHPEGTNASTIFDKARKEYLTSKNKTHA